MIIEMKPEHVRQVAKLHYQYINSLLRDLGERMCRVFYENALKSDNNFGFVYIEASSVLGFVFATKDNSKLFNSIKVRIEIIRSLLKKPFLILSIFSHLRNHFAPSAERLYAAVDMSCRQKGIALKLFISLNQEFKKRGVTYFEDSVDASNMNSLILQQFLGAKVKKKFTERGIQRYRLYTKLD